MNVVCLIFKGGEFLTADMQIAILVCAAIVGYIGKIDKFKK